MQNTHRRHAANMNLTIEGFKNIAPSISPGLGPGLGERAGSLALAGDTEPGIKMD